MAQVKFKGESDFEKVKRDYEALAKKAAKVEGENKKLAAAVNRTEKAQKRATKTMSSGFDQGIRKIKTAIGGFFALETAIRAVTAAFTEQREKETASLEALTNVAKADAAVVKNLVGESSQIKRETLDSLRQIAADTGVESEAHVKLGFSAAISKASGDRDIALQATAAAAQLNRLSPEDLPLFAGGGVSVARLAGVTDPRQALGFLADIQGRSPIVDPKFALQALPRTLAGVTGADVRGATAESSREAGALFAALGTAAGDETGAPTGTASIQLASQLRTFFASRQDPGTLRGRIESLQNDAALQQKFLEDMRGEAAFLIPFEQLVKGQGLAADEFRANLETLSVEGGRDRFEKQVRELGGLTSALSEASARAAGRGRAERMQTGDVEGARVARIREDVQSALNATAFTYLSYPARLSATTEFEHRVGLGVDPAEAGIRALQMRERSIRASGLQAPLFFAEPGTLQGANTGLTLKALGVARDVIGAENLLKRDDQLSAQQLRAVEELRGAIEELTREVEAGRNDGDQATDGNHRAAAMFEAAGSRTE